MKYHIAIDKEQVRKYTIKKIFAENWNSFLLEMEKQNKPVRETILEEVDKIISCQDPKNGFALYRCPKCQIEMRVPFTCKSRFCNCCGAKYSNDRALNMSAKLLNCPHRHVVFTIPEELRKFFALDRSLLNLLFQAAANTVMFCFNRRSKSENYIPGMICVLHTFGRDLKWNPHIHMILCEEAVGNSNTWKKFDHINYEGLRKSWQFSVLKRLSGKITDPSFKALVDKLYADHSAGFYVNSPPVKNFSAGVVNYIVRYAGRPVLAQSRITNYDGSYVTFSYTPHSSDGIVSKTLPVFDFIKKLIIHIPERNFKMIHYYGFYCIHSSKYAQYLLRAKRISPAMLMHLRNTYKSWRKRMIAAFSRDPLKCIYCGATLELLEILCNPRKISFYFSFPHNREDPYLERLVWHGKKT
jgi:hypothetical protein